MGGFEGRTSRIRPARFEPASRHRALLYTLPRMAQASSRQGINQSYQSSWPCCPSNSWRGKAAAVALLLDNYEKPLLIGLYTSAIDNSILWELPAVTGTLYSTHGAPIRGDQRTPTTKQRGLVSYGRHPSQPSCRHDGTSCNSAVTCPLHSPKKVPPHLVETHGCILKVSSFSVIYCSVDRALLLSRFIYTFVCLSHIPQRPNDSQHAPQDHHTKGNSSNTMVRLENKTGIFGPRPRI